MKQIDYLLSYCADYPELYNRVANKIYGEFGIQSAEVTLLCTYLVKEFENYGNRERNRKPDQKMGAGEKIKTHNAD